MVVKSKRVKAINSSGDRNKEEHIYGFKDETEKERVNENRNEEEECEKRNEEEECEKLLEDEVHVANEGAIADDKPKEVVEVEGREVSYSKQLREGFISNDSVEISEESNEQLKMGVGRVVETEEDVIQTEENVSGEVEGGYPERKGQSPGKVDEKHSEGEHAMNQQDSNLTSKDSVRKSRLKQGRKCGLCGCGTEGKPPRKLVHDNGDSDAEAYSGSSASEEPNYDMWDGFGDEPGWLGRLLGPINDRYGIAGIWVHQNCAVWSPEVYFAGLGCLKNVRAALCRGRALKCTHCGRPGATIGCRVDRCPKTYHLPCARANNCIFDHRKFLIACTDHGHIFQPHGSHYIARIKKLKAKKLKLEVRKRSNDVWRKDVEAEEKWLENCGEDEEFLKRESKRLHRDLLRIAPVYIGGSDSESQKLYEGWESVAGLQDVIRCMKEVVLLPLLYPEFFDNLGLTPPRGVLLHGYPGTGKTLVVRALIGSCARGDKRIAYFARKGADCLGKYVGDAERQLRLLFQVAERCQPSVIFFDEIDGLAPKRTRQQDQTHSSVVSTLLSLMDGLKSRGSVVVIGATNRPEAVDPALRRPGRFDREIYFPLPSVEDRAAILSLHTRRWPKPITGSMLNWIARKTVGFAGADLQALCTQAAIIALKKNFPLQDVLSAAQVKSAGAKRVPLPEFSVEERDWLEALSISPPPCSRREAGIAANDLVPSPLPMHLIPCLMQPLSTLLVSLHLDERLWLPSPLSKAGEAVKNVIVTALNNKRLPSDRWWSQVDNLLQEVDIVKELERRLSNAGMLTGEACWSGASVSIDTTFDDDTSFEPSQVHNDSTHSSLLRNMPLDSRKKSGFRILIAGSPRSGQRHLASCVLHCFVGNVEVHKVDLATILQEGHGDVMQGVTHILMKCASLKSCTIFMPRIDLWALETLNQIVEESDSSSTDSQLSQQKDSCFTHSKAAEKCGSAMTMEPLSVSREWSSFIEQLESICVSTSLIILATSEVPHQFLPDKIKQFFESNLSSCCPSSSMQTVPRFAVQVGDNFNRDMVINLSAVELSTDVIQVFLHLLHQRTHVLGSLRKKNITCNSVPSSTDKEFHMIPNDSEIEAESESQTLKDSIPKAPASLNNKTLKGKSSMMVAVSTFGHQVLCYPHFAELCWVTSKLKEGPCVDVSGPWRGWPFNSCVIRPSNSLDNVGFGSSNVKTKQKMSLVRGLVAVGLSAYRGTYASPKEVSLQVRKVLELLVAQINAKVNAGKDRCQYIRILSQVAYLEDMVNSWAHALQSLDMDPQMDTKLSGVGSPRLDNPVQGEESKENVTDRNSSLEEQAKSLEENGTQNTDCVCLNAEDVNLDSNSKGKGADAKVDFVLEHILFSHTTVDLNHPAGVQDVVNNLEEQNRTHPKPCEVEISSALVAANGEVGLTTSGVLFENNVSTSAESGGVNLSDSKEPHNKDHCLQSINLKPDGPAQDVEINFPSSKTTSPADDPSAVCIYHCCSGCLHTLQGLIQKILIQEWGLNRNDLAVDDVHDAVASLSVDLVSAVRIFFARENTNFINTGHGNPMKLPECPELKNCHCKGSESSLLAPKDCSCHSADVSHTFDLKLVFRDGVLVRVGSNEDVSFHCKFQTFCLCSLIESIVTRKK